MKRLLFFVVIVKMFFRKACFLRVESTVTLLRMRCGRVGVLSVWKKHIFCRCNRCGIGFFPNFTIL